MKLDFQGRDAKKGKKIMKTIILDGETFEFTSEQHKKLLKYAEKEILRKKLELALDARENDPKWKKKIQTIRSKDINKVSVVFDQLVSGYTGEHEENAIDTIYKNIQR